MKRIYLSLAILSTLFFSCSKQDKAEATVPAQNSDAEVESVMETPDSTLAETDAVSSATAVSNLPGFNGVVILPPSQQATVTLTMGGSVHSTSLLPGHYVKKGEVLATLENPDFINLQQTYLEATAQSEFLEKEYIRQQNLASKEAASQKRLQQSKAEYLSMKSKMEASAAQLKILGVDVSSLLNSGIIPYLEVKSPLSGYVTNMNINVGKYFNVGEPVCDVIDKTNPMILLTVYEKDLAQLHIGDRIEFSVNGISGDKYFAKVILIDQMVDSSNRSIKAYAEIEKANDKFRPGMYVSAKIAGKE